MSDYGLNFGFLRSDESSRSGAEGRYRTPVGSSLALGTMVEINPASLGYLKASAANAAFVTGYAGLLLQELEWDRSIYESDASLVDSFQKGVAKPNKLAVITSGAGTKVWFKNTSGVTRADGRVIAAKTMVTALGSLVVGDTLSWNATVWAKTAGGLTEPVMKVTEVDVTALRVECVLLK